MLNISKENGQAHRLDFAKDDNHTYTDKTL